MEVELLDAWVVERSELVSSGVWSIGSLVEVHRIGNSSAFAPRVALSVDKRHALVLTIFRNGNRYLRDQPQLTHPKATDAHYVLWAFEDFLKRYFFTLLQVLEVLPFLSSLPVAIPLY